MLNISGVSLILR